VAEEDGADGVDQLAEEEGQAEDHVDHVVGSGDLAKLLADQSKTLAHFEKSLTTFMSLLTF